jgi:hypothetical protein
MFGERVRCTVLGDDEVVENAHVDQCQRALERARR